jgi:hypothetical protein
VYGINAYTSLSDKVFEQTHRVKISSKRRFDSAELERAVKRIMLRRDLNQDTLLKDSPDAPCKVYVHSTLPMIYANPLSFVCTTSK